MSEIIFTIILIVVPVTAAFILYAMLDKCEENDDDSNYSYRTITYDKKSPNESKDKLYKAIKDIIYIDQNNCTLRDKRVYFKLPPHMRKIIDESQNFDRNGHNKLNYFNVVYFEGSISITTRLIVFNKRECMHEIHYITRLTHEIDKFCKYFNINKTKKAFDD